MAGRIERSYGRLLSYTFRVINPFKKVLMETECSIHKLINTQALLILKNDNFSDAYILFSDYIVQINAGVVWADQDMKSSGHFYSPSRKRGLYGNRDALSLAIEYYQKALRYWNESDSERSMFFLGAAVHLVQDMTVPQHANIRLFDDHRKYEKYIRRTYQNYPSFLVDQGGYYLGNVEEFIRNNARNAIKIYAELGHIKEDELRFYAITKYTLPLAQKTTAGFFMRFYRDTAKEKGQ
jgi:phospholipase C